MDHLVIQILTEFTVVGPQRWASWLDPVGSFVLLSGFLSDTHGNFQHLHLCWLWALEGSVLELLVQAFLS